MGTLSFVLWLILWWPLINLSNYLLYLRGQNFSEDGINTTAVLINFAIWVVIGIILYKWMKEDG